MRRIETRAARYAQRAQQQLSAYAAALMPMIPSPCYNMSLPLRDDYARSAVLARHRYHHARLAHGACHQRAI